MKRTVAAAKIHLDLGDRSQPFKIGDELPEVCTIRDQSGLAHREPQQLLASIAKDLGIGRVNLQETSVGHAIDRYPHLRRVEYAE